MPSYKLTYFDVRGRGELIRYVLHAAGRDFEDVRVNGEQWKELKPKTKFGQLPMLEVDGKELTQSMAIARYLAKELGDNVNPSPANTIYAILDKQENPSFVYYVCKESQGLAGKDNWEAACIDQLIDLTVDQLNDVVKVVFEKDEEKKKELQKNLSEEVFPKYLKNFEKELVANGGTYFVGTSLTVADLAVYCAFDSMCMKAADFLDSYPNLKAHRERVGAVPKLAEYVKNRKPTDI